MKRESSWLNVGRTTGPLGLEEELLAGVQPENMYYKRVCVFIVKKDGKCLSLVRGRCMDQEAKMLPLFYKNFYLDFRRKQVLQQASAVVMWYVLSTYI